MSKRTISATMMQFHIGCLDETIKWTTIVRGKISDPSLQQYLKWSIDEATRVKDALLAATCADVEVEAVERMRELG